MSTAKTDADGNLVINPLEIILMHQEFDKLTEINDAIQENLKEQVVSFKAAFVQLWNEVAEATLTGTTNDVARVLNKSKVFYDYCAKGL